MTNLLNRTGYFYCNTTVESYVHNLTSSFTDQRNEATMVATSVAMLFLAALFFTLNLFSRFSDVSAFVKPSIWFFLHVSLSLFLPVMSYLFSEAKNQGAATGEVGELPLRARTILMWMLLVELLYKKVEAISGGTAYSGTVERAARIAWLGYLVFYNLRSAGKKAFYGVLWVLAAAKLGQRFVTRELGKRSFAYGKNPQLLASYMAQTIVVQEEASAESLLGQEPKLYLKQCRYAVMGEEELEEKLIRRRRPSSNGDVVVGRLEEADLSAVVTVGSIWNLSPLLADDDDDNKNNDDPRLKRLCLSFALYKLLRRRLEGFPISDAEARNCHDLIFKGLCACAQDGDDEEDAAAAAGLVLFQVLNDEVQFLCEYYHSVHPVVFASPFFFLNNYIMFPIVVWALCVLMITLCSNGDVGYAFRSFEADNFPVSAGVARMVVCLLSKANGSPPALFSTIDLSVTVLLLLAFAYEQVWELNVFLLSNWFTVSLLSSYTSIRRSRDSPFLRGVIRRILWVRSTLSHPNVCFAQFSLLRSGFCQLSSSPALLPTKAVPLEAKKAIMGRLAAARPPRLSLDAVLDSDEHYRQWLQSDDELDSWARRGDNCLAEVILTWHIATALLEARFPGDRGRSVAVTLSGYCAYLVAFCPELLPDGKDETERVYEEVKEELKKAMGCLGYHCSGQGARCRKLMEIAAARPAPGQEETATTALRRGARLGKVLIEKASSDPDDEAAREPVWKLLADVWTEVVVYAAPTGSERHMAAHKEPLAQGGEFITLLWALTTHTGIARGPVVAATPLSV